ncbi:Probable terpene synthase 3 [Linum grandiflorum]
MMLAKKIKSPERLNLLDAIQRLGISYHFEPEIEQLVEQEIDEIPSANDGDLHTVALRFRILRQHGYNAPTGEFVKFKNEAGEFKKDITNDIEGLLSLYEASYMRIPGESILDEAIDFTKTHLMASRIDDIDVAERVTRALKRPLRKDMDRLQHLFFIRNYEKTESHNRSLLRLAKLSYNFLQYMYQQELKVLTKWWVELEFARKVSYARDKLVETYYWALGMLWEPKFALARYMITKGTTLGTVLDDTYDIYGTFEELQLFTSKCRWDDVTDDMDITMKYVYEAVRDFYHEIQVITSEEGRPYCFQYAKRMLSVNLGTYLEEQRWYVEGIEPSLNEYRQVSAVSTFYLSIISSALCGMGDQLASKEVFNWFMSQPKILFASADQCRLMDDIVTYQREQERGHLESSVQIYMKQFEVTTEEAVYALKSMIEDDWRVMNAELLKLANLADGRIIPKEAVALLLRMAQTMDVIYKEMDGYTCSDTVTKDNITALFVTPFQL